MIVLSDPRVADVPVRDCGEPLAEVAELPRVTLDPGERDPDGAYGRARAGVCARLRTAVAGLPAGWGFLVVEGHRSSAEQARRFARYQDSLRAAGHTDPAELHRRTAAFVAPVEVAPHCAGAALDLTLVDDRGRALDMGGAVNGHRTGDEERCPFDAPGLPARARHHRALLGRALGGAGFVNYPSEWWHWSYGDRYWALLTGARCAVYGPV
ncbi:dipeptidase [Streptomyces albulus]|uniref:M15 family metallopeptidase n=1 Tax=Streptomyces noursei TaxID=1971 RepID=UPI001F3D76CA|nr:M15 family metallopeptidase [Streptomyces noursei]MCE4944129.1 dipeptidase [Streptomyces noursei]